jgi:hypothetical protein
MMLQTKLWYMCTQMYFNKQAELCMVLGIRYEKQVNHIPYCIELLSIRYAELEYE